MASRELISKSDTTAIFGMNRAAWDNNVARATSIGMAKAMGSGETALGMAMTVDEAFLLVRPTYERDDSHPALLSVSVGYQPPQSELMSDAALEAVIALTTEQMAPEYSVFGRYDRLPTGAIIHFIIREIDS